MARKPPSKPASHDGEDTQSVWQNEPAAVYGLEQPVCCPVCRASVDRLYAVRLFRAKVNFMSSLPRSGRILVCPHCRAILPAELGAVL
jgi:hypothetical protein